MGKKPKRSLDTYHEVAAFARHLVEDLGWTAEELLGFLDKPWKWGKEFRTWVETVNGGKPRTPEVESAKGPKTASTDS